MTQENLLVPLIITSGVLVRLTIQTTAVRTNLALGKPTKASSAYGSSPSNLVDGNRNSRWDSHSCFSNNISDPMPWWMVDLQMQYHITSVQITNRGDCWCYDRLHDFAVEVSTADPTSYPEIKESLCSYHVGAVASGATVTLNCADNVFGRYMRIRRNITRNNNDDLFTMCEVEVYGTEYQMECTRFDTVFSRRFTNASAATPETKQQCARKCFADNSACAGFNYKSAGSLCELVVATGQLNEEEQWTYHARQMC